jgi:hypothetical protein
MYKTKKHPNFLLRKKESFPSVQLRKPSHFTGTTQLLINAKKALIS